MLQLKGGNATIAYAMFCLVILAGVQVYLQMARMNFSTEAVGERNDLEVDDIMMIEEESTDSSSSSYALASRESLGFFKDIPDQAWLRYKKRFQLTQPNVSPISAKRREQLTRYPNWFWASNFEPEFTCPHETRFGKLGDGGKWVCDPHRIVENTNDGKDTCLVYSVGSNGHFQFEEEVRKLISQDCEVHTFDPVAFNRGKNFTDEAIKAGSHFHNWGIGSGSGKFKTFKETITTLEHANKIIDVMKIDCENCEAVQFSQWLSDWKETGVLVRQVQLEVHQAPLELEALFSAFLKEGYVIFHKEANYLSEAKAVEVAFILLRPEFQQLDS